ncbi:MAG TPA: hypothetical protein VGD72_05745 [Mycobacteriales bacterium]|jgi:hypothetical protein
MVRQRAVSAREWLLVLAVGAAGLVLAAVAALAPWHVGGAGAFRGPVERVVHIHVPHGAGGAGVATGLS